MKKLLLAIFSLISIISYSQTTGYLRYDTVKVMRQNGNSTLIIENATRDTLGFLYNYGGGRTRFERVRAVTGGIKFGNDTIAVSGSGGFFSPDQTSTGATNHVLDGNIFNLTSNGESYIHIDPTPGAESSFFQAYNQTDLDNFAVLANQATNTSAQSVMEASFNASKQAFVILNASSGVSLVDITADSLELDIHRTTPVSIADSASYWMTVIDRATGVLRPAHWPSGGGGGSGGISEIVAGYGLINVNDSTFRVDTTTLKSVFVANLLVDTVTAAGTGMAPVVTRNDSLLYRLIVGTGNINVDTATNGVIRINFPITGTPTGSKYLRDDFSWQTISSGGITSLGGLTGATQTFAFGATGTTPNVVSSGTSHTFHFPLAAASVTSGTISATTQTIFGAKTLNDFAIFAAGFATNATGTNSNFNVVSSTNGLAISTSPILFGIASSVNTRAFFSGSSNAAVAAGHSVAGLVLGTQSNTEAASGTHEYNVGMLIKAQDITQGAGATTNAATLFINGAPTGTATITNPKKSLHILAGDELIEAGKLGIGIAAATTLTAHLNLGAGTTAIAPLQFTSGTNLTSPSNGSMEYNGTDFFITKGGTRQTIATLAGTETFTNKTLSTSTSVTAAITWGDGIKQVFNPDGTNAGINVGAHSANPSSPVNGDLVYQSTANELRAYINGSWVALGAGGGGVSDGDKGDITVSGTGSVFTIDNTAVTYAKMQNVATNNRLWGNIAGSNQTVQELTPFQVVSLLGLYYHDGDVSTATPDPTGDARQNFYKLTALAANAVFAAPSGTPAEFNTLEIRILDNGTSRTLGWNAIYDEGSDIPLPTATIAGEGMWLKFIYNTNTSKWELVYRVGGF